MPWWAWMLAGAGALAVVLWLLVMGWLLKHGWGP